MEILLLLVGLTVGALVGYFAARAKISAELIRFKTLYEQSVENAGTMKAQFEKLASDIITGHTERFEAQTEKNLQSAIGPLKENLSHFHARIEKYYEGENSERQVLKGEINKIFELNQRLSKEANSLAQALRGDSKMQGNWGEMILEKVLEASGLRRDHEYRTQVYQKNEEGASQFLDVVVDLPEGKHLIIDSKVTLRSYEAALRSDDPVERAELLTQFSKAIRDHIKGLSAKRYFEGEAVLSPDFVLIFFPLESAYATALERDPELFSNAWEKKVIIVSPTTLLATLKTVAGIWSFQRQSDNAQEIALAAGRLYDKFVGFTSDLDEIDRALSKASSTLSNAKGKLSSGRGNLVSGVEKLRELGAKNNKELPSEWGS